MRRRIFLILIIGFLSLVLLAEPDMYQWRDWVFHLTCENPKSCVKEHKTFVSLDS
jgi:hypothetical protein